MIVPDFIKKIDLKGYHTDLTFSDDFPIGNTIETVKIIQNMKLFLLVMVRLEMVL